MSQVTILFASRHAIPRRAQVFHHAGIAVVTALLITTLAVTIVTSVFWQQQVMMRSIQNQDEQVRQQLFLHAALDWSRQILRIDAMHSNVDHLDEPWAVPLAEMPLSQPVDNEEAVDHDLSAAGLSGNIIDAQSRFNLTNLYQAGAINKKEIAAFRRLLANVGLNPALAEAAAGGIAAGEPKNSNTTAGNGNSYGSQPMKIIYLDDLLTVPGFSADVLNKLEDFVVVLPRPTPLNANTASAEVLAAKIEKLSLSDAASLVSSREHAYFRDAKDFSTRFRDVSLAPPENEVTLASSFFIVNERVHLKRGGLEVQALIERNGSITRVVWVRQR